MPTDKKEILVPLTNSLYVKGNITRPDRVLVDIGTGFYVEKVRTLYCQRPAPDRMLTVTQDAKSAAEFYEGKIKDLSGNISELEAIVQNKSNTLRAVEEGELTSTSIPCAIVLYLADYLVPVLKQKILAAPKQAPS